MKVKNFIGTSGFSYSHWRSIFYPETLKSADFLRFYSGYFNTVEMNSTFYHTPRDSTIEKWVRTTPENFVFSVKASKFITHVKRLKDTRDSLSLFLQKAELFGKKLGVILFQLPPSLKKDLVLLKNFLDLLPKDKLFAMEFRHKSWLDEEVYSLLKDYNVAFCISDTPRYPYAEVITANFSYVRLHGHEILYASSYTEEQLSYYADLIKRWNKNGVGFFVYFDNDFYGNAVKNALELKKLIE
jgi:uncharacterized protein YecE (DUF72 family)